MTRAPNPDALAGRRLGVLAATLALLTSIGVVMVGGVYIGLACQACESTDGDWLILSLVVTFVVGVVGLIGVLVSKDPAVLAGVEATAAAGMVVAIAFVVLDGGDIHLDDERTSASFLYWVFTLIAILFLRGAVRAWTAAHNRVIP